MESGPMFSLNTVNYTDIVEEISKLDSTKGNGCDNNIPTKTLKNCSESTISILHNLFNKTISNGIFPDELKSANITPIFKKENPLDKKNYRPISVLPIVSKLFERLIQKQINTYINTFLSPYLCGFRKGYRAQQA